MIEATSDLFQQLSVLSKQLSELLNNFSTDDQEPRVTMNGSEAPFMLVGKSGDRANRLIRDIRPSLPEARLVRRIIRQRQLRVRYFGSELFADPAWDMLLDLTAARVEHHRVSVTSLCIASGVPPTTALRWISQMTDAGLLERVEDEIDRRRAFITLSDHAVDAVARYFQAFGRSASLMT